MINIKLKCGSWVNVLDFSKSEEKMSFHAKGIEVL